MNQFYDAGETRRPSHDRGPTPLRTYRQIAQILSERQGTAMTQARVGRMCRAAEMKITRRLRADPVICAQLR